MVHLKRGRTPDGLLDFIEGLNNSKPEMIDSPESHSDLKLIESYDEFGTVKCAHAMNTDLQKSYMKNHKLFCSVEKYTNTLTAQRELITKWVEDRETALLQQFGKEVELYESPLGTYEDLVKTKANYKAMQQDVKKYTAKIYRRGIQYDVDGNRIHTTGLPQGAGTSPFLSALYMDFVKQTIQKEYPSINFLIYADDMILYSNDDKEFDKFMTACNIKLGSKWKSLVDYSAAQIENKGAGFSGARTSNIEIIDPILEESLQEQWPVKNRGQVNSSQNRLIREGYNPFEVMNLRLSHKKCQVSKYNGI